MTLGWEMIITVYWLLLMLILISTILLILIITSIQIIISRIPIVILLSIINRGIKRLLKSIVFKALLSTWRIKAKFSKTIYLAKTLAW
jgi:hypothetical protein